MKTLKTYLNEKLAIFPSQVNEKLVINKSFKDTTIKVVSKQQLKGIISKRLKENSEELNLNDLDVSSVKDFSGIFSPYMFRELLNTKKIYIDEWNTESAENMTEMFMECLPLEEVDVSNFDVSNVESMDYMFRKCETLKKLDLTNWKVNKVRDMEKMFSRCESLETIGDVSGWEPENLEIFNNAFNGCKILKNVDTSKWSDYLGVVSSTDAFYRCPNIQMPGWA